FGPLAEAERLVTERHAEAVERFCREAGLDLAADVDLIGFHGQTVLHDPSRAMTVQLGDGDALAERLGTPVAWDFRAADMEAGGQGAPLAPAYHAALARRLGAAPLVFLNIGGVANVTWVGADGTPIAFDTGPGNALLDDWIKESTGASFDADGRLARRGAPSQAVVAAYMRHPYFAEPPPKSLDRNAFALAPVGGMGAEDGAATLLAFTVESILAAATHFPAAPRRWIACGGGRQNGAMMERLAAALRERGQPLVTAEAAGLDGDAIEAQAFAYLAVRSLHGLPITFPGTTGVAAPKTGGRIAMPPTGQRRVAASRQA
ncbi:MAG TPA: anhydro-N-acetylmuramic acid kinase, partial [Afifellaceae bacterium]|nr:anhydro-N-acetylmuramic acid kinase [Afifellaceae bacterium]